MAEARFERLVGLAMAAPIEGWHFPFLESRLVREQPSWDWTAMSRELLAGAGTALDHGTGGGEVLAELGVVAPLTVATEAYRPNVTVAARRLGPLGVRVVQVHGGTHNHHGPGADNAVPTRRLPFRDGWLDAFLVRNSSFFPTEAFRLLRPGGRLQFQAGLVAERRPGHTTLRELLGSTFDTGWGTWDVRDTVLAAGLQVDDYREQLLQVRYVDIAAVIFALRMAPWTVGEFRLPDHRARLEELHAVIERDGPLVTGSTAVFLRASRPH